MKIIQGIIFSHRPGTREEPQGAWYSPRFHTRRKDGSWRVWNTASPELGTFGMFASIDGAQRRMVELERIADAKESERPPASQSTKRTYEQAREPDDDHYTGSYEESLDSLSPEGYDQGFGSDNCS